MHEITWFIKMKNMLLFLLLENVGNLSLLLRLLIQHCNIDFWLDNNLLQNKNTFYACSSQCFTKVELISWKVYGFSLWYFQQIHIFDGSFSYSLMWIIHDWYVHKEKYFKFRAIIWFKKRQTNFFFVKVSTNNRSARRWYDTWTLMNWINSISIIFYLAIFCHPLNQIYVKTRQ